MCFGPRFTAALCGKHSAPRSAHLGWGQARSKEPYTPYRSHPGTIPSGGNNPMQMGKGSQHPSAPVQTGYWAAKTESSSGPPKHLKVWDLEGSSKLNLWELQWARKAASKLLLTSPLMGTRYFITTQEGEIPDRTWFQMFNTRKFTMAVTISLCGCDNFFLEPFLTMTFLVQSTSTAEIVSTGYRQKKHKSVHIKPLCVGHTLQPPIDNCLYVLCQLEITAALSITRPAAAASYTHCSIPLVQPQKYKLL